MRLNKHAGVILLAIWLIFTGLIAALSLTFTGLGIVMGILAIVAGIALLFSDTRKVTKNIGVILLAVWLILTGLIALVGLSFQGLDLIMGALALAAGVVLLFTHGYLKARWGIVLLGLWLIFTGLMALIALTFTGSGVIMGVIAIAAGLLLLVGR